MGCGSCGSGGCTPAGCGQKGGCATGGCNKLNTYDWLGNMLGPDQTEVDNIYEVRFKNTRKSFFRNVNGLRLYTGDFVAVESDRGYDVGQISLGGVLAELQMKKRGFKKRPDDALRIYRKANEGDVELLQELRGKEPKLIAKVREIIIDLKLEMKLSDIEFQGDGTKAIFYYIADHRVDFRELIKLLAREFRVRVEMKQIGLRHEAGLIGGIGACGRELCCSTWLTDFKTVSTSAARYQNLSLNPMKISGLCGRLKCCLNYELDSYMDALKDFPKIEKIKTVKGMAYLQKTDIFKGMMWFSYPDETSWHPLGVQEVKKIMELSEKGEPIESLSAIAKKPETSTARSFDFVDVLDTDLPDLPDNERGRRKRNKKRRRPNDPQQKQRSNQRSSQRNRPQKGQKSPQTTKEKTAATGEKKQADPRKRQDRPKDQQSRNRRGRNNRNNPEGANKQRNSGNRGKSGKQGTPGNQQGNRRRGKPKNPGKPPAKG